MADERYTNAIIDSTIDYLYKLQYLALNNNRTLRDLTSLNIINTIYNWAPWFEVSEATKENLEVIMSSIIRSNSNLKIDKTAQNLYYSNVSTPQNLWTHQRVYDNLDVVTIDSLT